MNYCVEILTKLCKTYPKIITSSSSEFTNNFPKTHGKSSSRRSVWFQTSLNPIFISPSISSTAASKNSQTLSPKTNIFNKPLRIFRLVLHIYLSSAITIFLHFTTTGRYCICTGTISIRPCRMWIKPLKKVRITYPNIFTLEVLSLQFLAILANLFKISQLRSTWMKNMPNPTSKEPSAFRLKATLMRLFWICRGISHLLPKISTFINMQGIYSFKTVLMKTASQPSATGPSSRATYSWCLQRLSATFCLERTNRPSPSSKDIAKLLIRRTTWAISQWCRSAVASEKRLQMLHTLKRSSN